MVVPGVQQQGAKSGVGLVSGFGVGVWLVLWFRGVFRVGSGLGVNLRVCWFQKPGVFPSRSGYNLNTLKQGRPLSKMVTSHFCFCMGLPFGQ